MPRASKIDAWNISSQSWNNFMKNILGSNHCGLCGMQTGGFPERLKTAEFYDLSTTKGERGVE